MGELESLEVKIKASTTDIDSKIDHLVKNVGNLESALSRIGGANFQGLASAMGNVSSALSAFKQGGVTGREFTTMADGLSKLALVDSGKLMSTASAMEQFSNAISGLGGAFSNGTATSLRDMASALSSFGSGNTSTASQNLTVLGSSVQTFANEMQGLTVDSSSASGITSMANAISQLGYKSVTNATMNIPYLSSALKEFVNTMNSTGDIAFEATNLTSLAQAISVLGRESSGRAVTNIPLLAQELKSMMSTLAGAPKVSQNLIDMTNALSRLASQGSRTSAVANQLTTSSKKLGSGFSFAQKQSHSLASTIGKLYARFWLLLRAFRMLGSAITYASDLTEVQNVIDNTFGVSTTENINKNAEAIEDLASKSIQAFGMSELSTKTIAGQFEAMATAMGLAGQASTGLSDHLSGVLDTGTDVTNMASQMALDLTALAGDMASFYNVEASKVASALQSGVMSGQARALRSYGMDLTQATLQEYALSKGIQTKVANMTQAEKTMLRYQYVMERTQNVQGDFARTSDKLCVA